jgi:hypothetical protein
VEHSQKVKDWFDDNKRALSDNVPHPPYLNEVLVSAIGVATVQQIDGLPLDLLQNLKEALGESELQSLNLSASLSKEKKDKIESINQLINKLNNRVRDDFPLLMAVKPLPTSKTPLDLTLSQFQEYVKSFRKGSGNQSQTTLHTNKDVGGNSSSGADAAGAQNNTVTGAGVDTNNFS